MSGEDSYDDGYQKGLVMASYSVAEAKDRLPSLLNAAQNGEEVVITRRGQPVATLNAVRDPKQSDLATILASLRDFRAQQAPSAITGADLVRRMRDEEPGF